MPDDQEKTKALIGRLQKGGLIATGLFLLYVVIGTWVVPPILKPKVEGTLSDLLGRKVVIGALTTNPLAISATVSDLTIDEIDGQPFAGFEELYANAQLSSIIRRALTFREIRVQGPFGVLKLLPENKLNIDDIAAKLAAPQPEPAKETGLLRAVVHKFQVVAGKATVDNLRGREPIHEEIAPISFTIENLSTLEGREGGFRFEGVGPLGGQIKTDGKISVNPVRVQGRYDIAGTRLDHYWQHFKDYFSFRIVSGTTAISGLYALEIIDGQINAGIENGAFELKNFQLNEIGKDEVLIALPTLSVEGLAADLLSRKAAVDRIFTADAAFKSWVAADGSSQLQRLITENMEKTTADEENAIAPPQSADAAPWQVLVRHIEVKNWAFNVDAAIGEDTIRETAVINSITVENLNTAADQRGTYSLDATGPSGGSYRIDGKLAINPVWSQGRYAIANVKLNHIWEHIKDYVAFQIADGSTGASGNFTVALDQDEPIVRLDEGTLQLDGLKLAEKGRDDVLVAIPAFGLQGIAVDLKDHQIDIASVKTADANIKSWLAADGTFALQKLLLPDQPNVDSEEEPNDPDPETKPPQPWLATIGNIEMRNWGVAFEDRTLTNTAKLSLDAIDVVVANITNREDTPATIELAMQINRAGHVKMEGTASIVPLQADLKFVTDKIALQPFQPYVDEAVRARIATGSTSSAGRIRYRGPDTQPQIHYDGEFSVDDLKIQDQRQTDDFITLAQFRAGGIALELIPNKLKASEVLIDRPQGKITIDQAGVVNVVEAFAPVEKQEGGDKQNLLQRLVNLLILQFKGPMPMQIDLVRLEGFTVDFTDASISPNFDTHLEISDGRVQGLASDPSAHADFSLKGSIDQTATIQGTGEMNPMNALRYSNVKVSLKDFALKSVSPYTGKYIGYKIDQGTLHTDLRYQVEDDAVKGNNIIRIDQLELGEKVDSPQAPNLPIKLAVSLLKDRDGRITVQVPVVGDVKDPQFDAAAAVRSALRRTVEDAGRDPFTTITAIDGFKGEDLRVAVFDFGLADLTAPETQKLNALAKYLKAKGALRLGVTGTADRQMDGAALAGTPPAAPASGDRAPLASDEDQTVDNAQLEELAQTRAANVSAYLIEQVGIPAERIQRKPVRIKSAPDGAKAAVAFSLSVE
jgi:outer membrane protein OmpA-like peptidoglycan-associated protein